MTSTCREESRGFFTRTVSASMPNGPAVVLLANCLFSERAVQTEGRTTLDGNTVSTAQTGCLRRVAPWPRRAGPMCPKSPNSAQARRAASSSGWPAHATGVMYQQVVSGLRGIANCPQILRERNPP